MSLVLLADVKKHLNITSSTDDAELQVFIDTAEAALAQVLNAGSTLAVQSVTQRAAGYAKSLVLTRAPVVSVTSVTGAYTGALSLSDLDIDLEHGLINYPPLMAFAFWDPWYTIVYQAGYTAQSLPLDLALAVKELVRHFWTTQRGAVSARPGPGGFNEPFPASGYSFPNRVLELVKHYTVSGFA